MRRKGYFRGGYKNDDQRKAIFANMYRKSNCTPASVPVQKTWGKLPSPVKGILGKILPDRDRDRVPNLFDCQPCNPLEQESFSPEDQTFLDSLPEIIEVGNHLPDIEQIGGIYELAGNPDFVVKIPYTEESYDTGEEFKDEFGNKFEIKFEDEYEDENEPIDVEREWNIYKLYNLEMYPFILPMTKRYLKESVGGIEATLPVLVKPKLTAINDPDNPAPDSIIKGITPEQLEGLRLTLLALAKNKLFFTTNLNIGVDKHGKLYLQDFSLMAEADDNCYEDFALDTIGDWDDLLSKLNMRGKVLSLDPERRIEQLVSFALDKTGKNEALKERNPKKAEAYFVGGCREMDKYIPGIEFYYKKMGIPMPKTVKLCIEVIKDTIKRDNEKKGKGKKGKK